MLTKILDNNNLLVQIDSNDRKKLRRFSSNIKSLTVKEIFQLLEFDVTIVPPESIGALTDGLIFIYKDNYYWEYLYETVNYTKDLLKDGAIFKYEGDINENI